MKEIKFRAWDKEHREMKSDITLDVLKIYGNSLNEGLKHTELMQFTGLKDKNGKEIYENTLVHIDESNRQYLQTKKRA